MQNIFDHLTNLTWQDWVALAGFLFGFVTLIAYIDQRRAAKGQEAIIEFVKRNVQRDISVEALQQLEVQQKEMSQQVNEYIPALARTAVLKEQAEAHSSAISQHFLEWKRIQEELKSSPSRGNIDPVMENIIVDKLVPKYEQAAALDKVRNIVTVLSIAFALAGVVPYPLNFFARTIFAIPLILNLIKFYKFSVEPEVYKSSMKHIFFVAYAATIILCLFGSMFLFSLGNITYAGRILAVVLICLGGIELLLLPIIRRKMKRILI